MKNVVLVIEDEPIIAEMMSILLEVEGFKVISIADTAFAKRQLESREVNLVMLDLKLKDEDGRAICGYIKEQENLKQIPVILVSASGDLEQIAKDCHADDFIQKPFDIDHFMSKVHRYTGSGEIKIAAKV